MAKKHKNFENIKIHWDGILDDPPLSAGDQGQEIPTSVDLGTWGGYIPVWFPDKFATCTPVYFEDYDIPSGAGEIIPPDGNIDNHDGVKWVNHGRGDIGDEIIQMVIGNTPYPDKAPKVTYTWGDVSFLIEIADGLGTGNRRAREARLHKFDKDTKRRLIHLICRVKGEKVYDEEKEVGDIQIKLEDADLVINEVLGKMRVENTNVL